MGTLTEQIKVATGHNNAAGFTTFLVEPWLPHIIPGIVTVALSQVVFKDGNASADLIWGPKVTNAVKVDALSKCGLSSATYALVTVRLRSNRNRATYSNYNATAYYPEEDDFERRGATGFLIRLLFLTGI